VTQEVVYLMAMYDKSEKENLDAGELDAYLDLIEDDTTTD